jgi:hypothetical protein
MILLMLLSLLLHRHQSLKQLCLSDDTSNQCAPTDVDFAAIAPAETEMATVGAAAAAEGAQHMLFSASNRAFMASAWKLAPDICQCYR